MWSRPSSRREKIRHQMMVFLRFVGIVLLVAAAPKIRHPDSFRTALTGYGLFPEWSLTWLQYGVPLLEVLLGLSLILFLNRRAVKASALLFGAFTLVLGYAWSQDLALTCGCFGRIDRYLHQLPHGLLLHIVLNALVTLGLCAAAVRAESPEEANPSGSIPRQSDRPE